MRVGEDATRLVRERELRSGALDLGEPCDLIAQRGGNRRRVPADSFQDRRHHAVRLLGEDQHQVQHVELGIAFRLGELLGLADRFLGALREPLDSHVSDSFAWPGGPAADAWRAAWPSRRGSRRRDAGARPVRERSGRHDRRRVPAWQALAGQVDLLAVLGVGPDSELERAGRRVNRNLGSSDGLEQ